MAAAVTLLMLQPLMAAVVDAAAMFGPAKVSPDDPDSCLDEDTGEAHRVNTSWIPTTWSECGRADCIRLQRDDESSSDGPTEDNNTLYIMRVSCGVAAAVPPCYLVANKSAMYPDCCEQIYCPPQQSSTDDSIRSDESLSLVPTEKSGVQMSFDEDKNRGQNKAAVDKLSRQSRQIVFRDSEGDEVELLPLPLKSATAFDIEDHEVSLDDVIDWDGRRRQVDGKQLKKSARQLF